MGGAHRHHRVEKGAELGPCRGDGFMDLFFLGTLRLAPVVGGRPLQRRRQQIDMSQHANDGRTAQFRAPGEEIMQVLQQVQVGLAGRVACMQHQQNRVRFLGRFLRGFQLICLRALVAIADRIDELESSSNPLGLDFIAINLCRGRVDPGLFHLSTQQLALMRLDLPD